VSAVVVEGKGLITGGQPAAVFEEALRKIAGGGLKRFITANTEEGTESAAGRCGGARCCSCLAGTKELENDLYAS